MQCFSGRVIVVLLQGLSVVKHAYVARGVASHPRCELVVVALHPGVTRDQVVAATGWEVRFTDDAATTDEPTDDELDALRRLQAA